MAVVSRCALVLSAVTFLSSSAGAQSLQKYSIQVSGLYASLFGDAYSGVSGGVGAEGQLRVNTTTGWSFGAGVQYTTHSLEGVTEKMSLLGPFFEPRYAFVLGKREDIFPYLSGRFSILQQRLSVSGVTGTTSGTTLNGGGGVLVPLGTRVNLDAGATYGYTTFGEITLTDKSNGQSLTTGKGGSGSNIVVRVGLAIGL